VTAQAFNSTGQPGRQIVSDVVVNCSEPGGPTGVAGGFDWRRCVPYPTTCASGERILDLDWNPNPEADIIAYYVFRVVGVEDWSSQRPVGDGADIQLTCVARPPLPATDHPGPPDFLEPFKPACWDAGLPDQPALGITAGLTNFDGTTAKYYVRAVDPDPSDPTGATRRAVLTNHSALFTVVENMLNVRPTPPVLTITNVGGSPCLSWTDSVDLDSLGVNLGAGAIRFYRIYRAASNAGIPVVDSDPGPAVVNVDDVPYADRIARAQPNQPGSCDTSNPTRSYYLDASAGSAVWSYWVTAVDQNYLESFPSPITIWTPPPGP
jgi:hypothetical protein